MSPLEIKNQAQTSTAVMIKNNDTTFVATDGYMLAKVVM